MAASLSRGLQRLVLSTNAASATRLGTAAVTNRIAAVQLSASCSPAVHQPSARCLHTSVATAQEERDQDGKRFWDAKNRTVLPPQAPGEPRNPASIWVSRRNFKYSHHKLWYIATMVRGMSIDEALAQLQAISKKGARLIEEVLLEAQERAVKECNVEYKSNLWVAESLALKGRHTKQIRYHGRGHFGIMHCGYCHYLVRLEEGPPPPKRRDPTGYDKASDYMDSLRKRTIQFGM
ncbi:PREDICTED: 39S ribosomal protein L22, mitochondrial-like [Branchiostoma belcheri]|uniref:Large ribosomal subunit protein uL22m n=1 Tax=Branchiostoma belcheri TaxID=7741 RepID=A0A6P4Z6I1_BRABE|nr:PREDICTED: 39S ribosomal protein L22, mitochondrial-like [Branchiostoma belcheri]